MKIKVNDRNVSIFLMTLLVFLDMEPFFVWSSVSSLGYRLYTGVILVTTLFMTYTVCKKKITKSQYVTLTDREKLTVPLILTSVVTVILFFYEVFFSGVVTTTQQPFNMAMLCIHLGLMMFILQDNLTLRSVFLASKKIFAVTLIPAAVIFVLMQIGISLPHITLAADTGKSLTGQSYELYMGTATVLRNSGEILNRLCGMYREPGFVGTVGALFLLGDKFTLRKWENVVILVASVFTFSLAFAVLLVLGLSLRALGRLQNRKQAVTALFVLGAVVAGYFIFMSLPLSSTSMLGELQSRLVITEDGLAGDNRFGSSIWAEEAYDDFLNSDLRVRLLGYGQDNRLVSGTEYTIWQNVHSYKEFVFNFGFIGLILLGLSLVLPVLAKFRGLPKTQKWDVFVLTLVFVISIYQRYDVSTFYYFCLLFGGAANLALMSVNTEEETQKEKKSSPRVVLRWGSAG